MPVEMTTHHKITSDGETLGTVYFVEASGKWCAMPEGNNFALYDCHVHILDAIVGLINHVKHQLEAKQVVLQHQINRAQNDIKTAQDQLDRLNTFTMDDVSCLLQSASPEDVTTPTKSTSGTSSIPSSRSSSSPDTAWSSIKYNANTY